MSGEASLSTVDKLLYLGRVASFAAAVAGLDPAAADERLEALCLEFERSRDDLVALWTAPAR